METLLLEEIFRVNFNNDSENNLNTINNRVANQTKEVSKTFLKSGQVTAKTKMLESIWNFCLVIKSQRNLSCYEMQSETFVKCTLGHIYQYKA